MYNNNYRYTLDKSSKKFRCPECSKKKFVRYINNETGNYLPEKYGRCDREVNCFYYLNPYKDKYGRGINDFDTYYSFQKKTKPKLVFMPLEVLKATQKGYDKNIFIQNLLNNVAFPFETDVVEKVISLYHLGTVQNGYRTGAITFPFIDVKNQIRTIQVKQFDKSNHTVATDFLHSIIEKHYNKKNELIPDWLKEYAENELKVSCLFGEHLLNKYQTNSVAIVEAPKTAIYGTLYFGLPKYPTNLIWLAVYNLSSLNFNKIKILKGRNVHLFPDLSKNGKAFDEWSAKAKLFEMKLPNTKFIVSDLLELNANEEERANGFDLADFLIKQDWRKFRMLRS